MTHTTLFNMAVNCHPSSKIAKDSIESLLKEPSSSPSSLSESRQLDPEKLKEFKHLLDLVHKFMLVGEILEKKEEGASPQKQEQGRRTIWKVCDEKALKGAGTVWKCCGGKALNGARTIWKFCGGKALNSPQTQSPKRTLSAVELRDHGVTFKKAEQRELYNITFEKGLLQIPVIQIDDATEVRFRNMIAYEGSYIKDYMDFMDSLVNTREDAKLLRRHEIIKSFVGDDETVATVFNKMCKNVVISPNSYYKKIADDLSDYCKRRRHGSMVKFWDNYLSSPWAILSVFAASILLILTMTQTVYTALSYYNAK
ncbi:hypothetical protein CRG98_022020 [Punica granatum]|nr:hypothetical protein CRG98_022020 [Punica granatum]